MRISRNQKIVAIVVLIAFAIFIYLGKTGTESRGLIVNIKMSDIGNRDMGRYTSVRYGQTPTTLSNVNLLRVNITLVNIPTSITTYSNIHITAASPAPLAQVCVGKTIASLPPNSARSIICDISKTNLDTLIGQGIQQWAVTITAYNDGLYKTEAPFISESLPVEVLS